MCDWCDRVVELLEQTRGINSGDFTYVEFGFPNGKPKLVRAADNAREEREIPVRTTQE